MQATITLITLGGSPYPVGGCYFAKVSRSSTSGYYACVLTIITPSGDREYALEANEPSNYGGTARPTPRMQLMHDLIVKALKDNMSVLDLREVELLEVESPRVANAS